MVRKLFWLVIMLIIGFVIWKYGLPYINGSANLIDTANKLKTDVQTSVENLKKEGEAQLKQVEDLQNKVKDKADKFGKTVDAVNELVK